MTPEEGMRAHLDLQGGEPHGVPLPVHRGTFEPATHPWAEPGEWTPPARPASGGDARPAAGPLGRLQRLPLSRAATSRTAPAIAR
jgi:hypothetical protein